MSYRSEFNNGKRHIEMLLLKPSAMFGGRGVLICSRMVCSEKKKSTENAYLMFSPIFNALVCGIVQHELGGARRTHPTPTPRHPGHPRSWSVVPRVECKQHV